MAHYVIAQIDIKDREKYAEYEAGFMDVFKSYQGKLLSVDENVSLLEGQWPATRTVLIEFPSKEEALAWYESEEYQSLAKQRFAASTSDIAVISGLD